MGLFDSLFGGGDREGIENAAANAAWAGSTAINYGVNTSHELITQALERALGGVSPWNKAGKGALDVYASLLGLPGYETSFSPQNYLSKTPGYQWQLGQGQKALDASAAGRGMLLSGPQRQASQQFGQGHASNYYDKLMNSLSGLSNTGLAAGGTMGDWENQAARFRSDLQMKGAYGARDAYNMALQGQLAQMQANQQQDSFAGGNILGAIGSGIGLLASPFTGGTSLLGMGANALGGLFGGGGGSSGGGYTPTWNNTLSQFNSSSYGR